MWWLAGGGSLAPSARAAIADPDNEVAVSAATVWEAEIKMALGRLSVAGDLVEAIDDAGFLPLPILMADARAAARLPRLHGDPFDRMLVAQAARDGRVICTRDPAFAAYGVAVTVA